jgi:hypothetical protein
MVSSCFRAHSRMATISHPSVRHVRLFPADPRIRESRWGPLLNMRDEERGHVEMGALDASCGMGTGYASPSSFAAGNTVLPHPHCVDASLERRSAGNSLREGEPTRLVRDGPDRLQGTGQLYIAVRSLSWVLCPTVPGLVLKGRGNTASIPGRHVRS